MENEIKLKSIPKVYAYIAHGLQRYSNKQIAEKLGVSVQAVLHYLKDRRGSKKPLSQEEIALAIEILKLLKRNDKKRLVVCLKVKG